MKFYSKMDDLLGKKINLTKQGIIALGLVFVTSVTACTKQIKPNNDFKPVIVENIDYEIDKTIKEINEKGIYEVKLFEGTLTIKEIEKSEDYEKIGYLLNLLSHEKISIDYIPCSNVNINFSDFNLDNCTFGFTFTENKINRKKLKKSIKNIQNCSHVSVMAEKPDYIDEIIKIVNLVGLNDEAKNRSVLIKCIDDNLISKIINEIDSLSYFDSFFIHSNDCRSYFGNLGKVNSNSISVVVSSFGYDENTFSISNFTNKFSLYYDNGIDIRLIYEYERPKIVEEKSNGKFI